ncbi:MAG: hypothetical protein LBI69_05015 [Puniceicoccales bacterium]|jgi:hypothetical protein|nr:hypothetical protein [Puniceicoccales bacterium]
MSDEIATANQNSAAEPNLQKIENSKQKTNSEHIQRVKTEQNALLLQKSPLIHINWAYAGTFAVIGAAITIAVVIGLLHTVSVSVAVWAIIAASITGALMGAGISALAMIIVGTTNVSPPPFMESVEESASIVIIALEKTLVAFNEIHGEEQANDPKILSINDNLRKCSKEFSKFMNSSIVFRGLPILKLRLIAPISMENIHDLKQKLTAAKNALGKIANLSRENSNVEVYQSAYAAIIDLMPNDVKANDQQKIKAFNILINAAVVPEDLVQKSSKRTREKMNIIYELIYCLNSTNNSDAMMALILTKKFLPAVNVFVKNALCHVIKKHIANAANPDNWPKVIDGIANDAMTLITIVSDYSENVIEKKGDENIWRGQAIDKYSDNAQIFHLVIEYVRFCDGIRRIKKMEEEADDTTAKELKKSIYNAISQIRYPIKFDSPYPTFDDISKLMQLEKEYIAAKKNAKNSTVEGLKMKAKDAKNAFFAERKRLSSEMKKRKIAALSQSLDAHQKTLKREMDKQMERLVKQEKDPLSPPLDSA